MPEPPFNQAASCSILSDDGQVLALSEPAHDMLEAAMPNFPDYGFLDQEYRAMLRHVAVQHLN